MQTTLLGLGIAIILALVAALVGPYFVDWSAYRATFEREATRIVGMPVTIGGKIDARLLPVPSLTLHRVEGRKASDQPKFTAQEVYVEFALGPLMRGEWRISEMHLAGPRIGVGLTADGRVDWVGTEAGIDPNSIAIEHLTIDNGRVILADAASGAWLALNKFSFAGGLRSLAGPINGEGSFVTSGGAHTYHLNLGRIGDDGAMHARLVLDPADPPIGATLDGKLSFNQAAPQFDGTLQLARQPGVSLVDGRAVTDLPWTLAGKLAVTSAHGVFDQVQLQYGPENRALKLGGKAELKFGPRPQLEATLSTRQADLDRFVGLQGAISRLPLVAIRSAADAMGATLQPHIPAHISINIDALMLAGATLQDVHGDFSADDRGWSINKLDLRAPGITRIHAAGRLTRTPGGHSFSGPATVESADPKALAAWMEGGTPWPGGPVGALRASGDVTLGSDRIVVDRLSAEIDRKRITGHLDYSRAWQGKGPRLEAALSAAELDLDGAAAFLRNALPEMRLDLPAECVLALDIDHATVAGVEAERAKAKLRFDADGLAIDELTIGDFAGAAVAVSGRVQAPWSAPTGALKLTLSGQHLDGLAGPLGRVAPRVAETLSNIAPRLGPAALTLALTLAHPSNDDTGSLATLKLDGTVGTLRVAATGNARGHLADWTSAQVHGDAKIDADDGRALARLLAFDQTAAVAPGAGSLHVTADGAGTGALAFKAGLAVPGVTIDADGRARLGADGWPAGNAVVSATIADATALRAVTGKPDQPAPLSLKTKVGLADSRFTFDDLAGQMADSRVSGQLALKLAPTGPRIEGHLGIDRLHAGALLAALAGMPKPGAGQQSAEWPSQPFGPRFLAGMSGRIALTAQRADLGPRLEIRQAQAALRLKESEASLADIHGTLAGGRLTGDVSLQRGVEGIDTNFKLGLNGADLGTLLAAGPHPAVAGRVSVQVEAKGSGRTPLVLVETLGGSGSLSAERLDLAGLDPAAFDAAARLADQSAAIDAGKLKTLVESQLGKKHLRVARLDGTFTLSAGQARLGGVIAHTDKADLNLAAIFDLAKSDLDARITLQGAHMGEADGRPEISIMLKGPLTAPTRTVDVSTLAGWLTLRAVDQQAKRLEAAEVERRKADEAARRMEEAARQAAAQQRAAEAAEQKRRAAEAAAAQIAVPPAPAAQIPTNHVPAAPTAAPASSPTPQSPRASHAPALPPPIDIRPLPGQHPSNSARPVPHILTPAHESVLRPSAVIQRDPRLPQ